MKVGLCREDALCRVKWIIGINQIAVHPANHALLLNLLMTQC